MTEANTQKTRTILVAVDFSETSDQALAAAIDVAAVGSPAELHVLTVYQPLADVLNAYALPPPPPVKENVERARMLSVRAIEAGIKRHGAVKISAAVAHGAIGEPATEIVRFASAVDADLVVLGSHSRKGLDRFFLGSIAEKVVRRAGCPVMVVRPKQHAPVAKEPQVEPPCDACLQRRADTKGKELWCARHAEHHPRAHVFHYEGASNDAARPWGFDAQ